MPDVAPATLLDPTVLAGIGDLALLARTVVDGFAHGAHRSRRTGLSLDFAEHREYQPGDDVRRIDWRLHARTDRYFLKTYEAETNTDLIVALDVSRSMDFGSGALTKFGWGRALAASVAWLAAQQGDRVGYVALGGDGRDGVPPSARHLPLVLQAMARAAPVGTAPLAEALDRLARQPGRAGMWLIVSDCYEAPERIAGALGALRARGHDVILAHVVDPAERELPYGAPLTLSDLESGVRLALDPISIAADYRARFAAHAAELATRTVAAGVDVLQLASDQPLDRGLRGWLAHRRRPEAAR